MPRKELFYYVTRGSNVTRDVHWCVTVFYQQIENSNTANQIHGFTIDYGKFILIIEHLLSIVLIIILTAFQWSIFNYNWVRQVYLYHSQGPAGKTCRMGKNSLLLKGYKVLSILTSNQLTSWLYFHFKVAFVLKDCGVRQSRSRTANSFSRFHNDNFIS